MKDLNGRRLQELEALKQRHDGLKAEAIVEFARDENTALHSWFEWDDSQAAHSYRIIQARTLIRIMVAPVEGVEHPVRVYVSLMDDRKMPGGGYRSMEDVMADPELRQQALKTALIEASAFRKRYKELTELAEVFSAIEAVEEKYVEPQPA